jgi:hypothetical protein
MLASVATDTGTVVTVKDAVRAPAGTVTVGGTIALGVFDPKVTTEPPGSAGTGSTTVPVADAPPVT